jgi:hypothetical protein
MQLREVLTEAWRDIAAGTTHVLRWACVLAVVVAALGWLDTATVRDQVSAARDYVAGGGATWVLETSGRVDGTTCDALSETDGIIASGALRTSETTIVPAQLPKAPLTHIDATVGMFTLLHAPVITGAALTDRLAAQLGLAPGSEFVAVDDSRLSIDAVFQFPSDGRRSGLGYTIITPADTSQPFDECWVQVWPPDDSKSRLIYLALLPDAGASQYGDSPHMMQLNSSLGATLNATALFESRTTSWVPLACLVAGVVIGAAAVSMRRLEFASTLHCGVSKPALVVQVLLETLAWAVLGVLLATPAILSTAAAAPQDSVHVALLGLRGVIAGGSGAVLGAAAAALAVQEKQLFTLFKNR